MQAEPNGLSVEELEAEQATDLPEREALSIVDPGVFSVVPTMPLTHAGQPPDVEGSPEPNV
jgi:hypothetical protein